MLRYHKTLLIVIALAGVILLLSQCINSASASTDPRGELYAGAATCRQCHQAIYDSFASTAHFAATAPANKNNVLGNFKEGQNQFNYDDSSTVKMEQRGNDFFQVLYVGGKEQNAYKYELLFGKKHAQSAVFWADDKTLQLPITHYNTFNAWGTSPGAGYSIAKPIFNRYISTECYECHSANISTQEASFKEMDEPKLDRGSVVYGIDCERCHGPGMNHVNYHQTYPGEKVAAYMRKNSEFSRGQKLDACAVCHSGNDKAKLQSRFLFSMGDTLSYFFMPYRRKGATGFDVHGNQFGLLGQSKCFSGMSKMTCGTCHDPHRDANEGVAFYSQKCMSCHQPESKNFCPKAASLGETIKANCIDCHMPAQTSGAITFFLDGQKDRSSYMLRTHRIAVYGDSTIHSKTQHKAANK